mgnify:FL=1
MNGRVIELTEKIELQYKVSQYEDKESWFKIYNGKELIFEITYVNPHKPFILPAPFAYDEDFNTTNFAYHLANYIKKVKENPTVILFSSDKE